MGISKKLASATTAFLMAVSILTISLSSGALAAGSATLKITPSSGTYKVGDNITVSIFEDSGSVGINAVEVDLNYNPSLLQYVSSTNSNVFGFLGVPRNPSAGLVTFVGFIGSSEVTGNQSVGTITFKALAAGTANISFATQVGSSGTAIMRKSDAANIWNRVTSAGSFTISSTTAPVTSTTTPKPTSGTSQTSSTPTQTTSKSTPSSSQSTNTSNTASSAGSVQGETSTGYMLAIKIVDENNKIVVGAKVTLEDGTTAISDASGIASFTNVNAGQHKVEYVINGKKNSQVIDVKGVSSEMPQQYTLQGTAKKFYEDKNTYLAAVAIIALLIILYLIIRNLRKPKDHHMDGAPIITGPAPGGSDASAPPPPPTGSTINPQNVGTVYQPIKSTTVESSSTPQNNETSTRAQL